MEDPPLTPITTIRPYLRRFSARKASSLRQVGIIAVLVFLACGSIGIVRAGQEAGAAKPSGPAAHGVELTILDKTCKPCEDFYHFASGEWLAKNPVPPAYPAWGRFNELAERNRELLHQILEASAANKQAPPGSNEQKIGIFTRAAWTKNRSMRPGRSRLTRNLLGLTRFATQGISRPKSPGCRLWACARSLISVPHRMRRIARK